VPALSRRHFLGLGTATLGLLAVAWQTVGQLGSYPSLPFAAHTLTPKTAAILAVLGEWLLPPGGPLPGSGGDIDSLKMIDDFLGGLPAHHKMLILALPLLFEHGTALERFGADRLTAMAPDQQQAYLDRWFFSDEVLRAQLITALKIIWSPTYLDRADTQIAMGIPVLCGVAS